MQVYVIEHSNLFQKTATHSLIMMSVDIELLFCFRIVVFFLI